MSQKGFNTGSNTIIAKKPFSFLELYPSSKVGHSLSLSLTWCENYLKVRHRSNLPLFSLSKKSHRSSIFVIIFCADLFFFCSVLWRSVLGCFFIRRSIFIRFFCFSVISPILLSKSFLFYFFSEFFSKNNIFSIYFKYLSFSLSLSLPFTHSLSLHSYH